MHTQPIYANDHERGFPCAERLNRMGLSLPSSPDLTSDDVINACEIIKTLSKKLKKTRSLELINEFEQEFSVDKWEVNGLKIWPAIRIPLISKWEKELYYGDGALDSEQISWCKRFLHEGWLISWSFLKYLSCFFKNTQADVGIWGLGSARLVTSFGYYSPYGDALRDLEKGSGLNFLCFDLTIKSSLLLVIPQLIFLLAIILLNLPEKYMVF